MPTKASWLKLVKRGTEITCYSAFDSGGRPGDWHQAAPPSPVATGLVYVGLYVSGGGAGTSATATFDHVTLSTGNLPALDNGIYTVVPESARALVMDASNTAGAAINSPASPPAAAQRWRITDFGGGLYRLAPDSDPSLCLTVAGAPAANGAKVRLEPDRGQASQRWRILTLGDDRYGLAPAFAPNLRLDDFGGNTTPGFLLDVWELIPNDPHTTWIIRGAE